MTEMLMTEAPQTNSAEASQAPELAPQGDAPSYGGERIGEPEQQATDAQNQEAQGEANAGEEQGEESNEVLGAPESYEFTDSEDYKVDGEVLNAFKDAAKDLNLSNEAAQKLVDKMAPQMAQRSADALAAMQQEWTASAKADKEFGGEMLAENLSVAKKALDAFGTPELGELLNQSGLGNHPEVIRMMYRAGKAISGDSYVGPSSGSGQGKSKPNDMAGYASALYSNQQPN
mgnify:CR=1 FL=1|tara:strand:- start:1579 stop:2271 length:693 start_codon:yes stop_codon:yes gene_type:complete